MLSHNKKSEMTLLVLACAVVSMVVMNMLDRGTESWEEQIIDHLGNDVLAKTLVTAIKLLPGILIFSFFASDLLLLSE
jgi:hypothetical protein